MNTSVGRWPGILAAGAVAGLLAGCGASGGSNGIVVYNGQHPQLTQALVSTFTHQTGIPVRVRSDDGIVLADQLLQEGYASSADVYMTENSPELMNLEAHRLLFRLPPATLSQVPPVDDSPAGDWVGVALRVSTLVYNPARIPVSQLPSSVLDLAQPQWRARFAIAPSDSDFPPVVGAVIARYGKTATERWLQGLKRNALIFQSDEAVVAAVNRGDAVSGVINQYYWYRLALELGRTQIHSALHYFAGGDPGSIVNISGAAVLASSRHKAAAEAFVRFLVSPAAQRLIAGGGDFEYPVRRGSAPNPALPPLRTISHTRIGATALGTDATAATLIEQAGLA